MYPNKGGNRLKLPRVDYAPTHIKEDKLSISCEIEMKEKAMEMAAEEGLTISEFGHKVFMLLVQLKQSLPKDASLLDFLGNQAQVVHEMQESLQEDKQAKDICQARVNSLEKQQERLHKKIETLSQEKGAIEKQIKDKGESHIQIQASAEMQQTLEAFFQAKLEKGENKSKEGVLAFILYEHITGVDSAPSKEFKYKGSYRNDLEKRRKL